MSLSILVVGMLILTRLTGMIVSMPVMGFKIFPRLARIIVVICLTMVILPTVPEVNILISLELLIPMILIEILKTSQKKIIRTSREFSGANCFKNMNYYIN